MVNLIKAKLIDIQNQKEQLVAQLNACCGAEQTLNELLKELEQGGEDDGEHTE